MRTSRLLWLLMGLFALRVLGQILVEFFGMTFLPPSAEWFSGVISYPSLLASQILILALMTKINADFTRQHGWAYRPRRHLGKLLLILGSVYLNVMLIRYVIRMTLYPLERWTGGSIPIFFHLVLAGYLLVLGVHHWKQRIKEQPSPHVGRWKPWTIQLGQFAASLALIALIALWTVYQLLPTLLARQLGFRGPEYAVRVERKAALTTADGIELAADIYHPQRAGPKTPTILVRIPLSKTFTNQLFAGVVARMWAERGYTVVIQGTRGRYESGGTYYPLRHEREDGQATLEWLARQPWYDGRLGMWGGSYFGYTQLVIADCGPQALIVQESSTGFYSMFYPGGAFSLKSALYWAVMSRGKQDVKPDPAALERGYHGFPVMEADDRAGEDIPFFNDWAAHSVRDDYWQAIDGQERAARIRAPTLFMAGWFDPFLPQQLDDYVTVRKSAAPEVAAETRLIIGPWAHAETVSFPGVPPGRNYRLESLAPTIPWFDRHLQSRVAAPPQTSVRIYTMGIDRWRDEQEWPLARTNYTAFYLHSEGHANTSAGDGSLSRVAPEEEEPSDVFIYDPNHPVPTAGGAMLGPGAGMSRQNDIETRADVLIYSTQPVEEALEITGPIELFLHVSTTAPATDFTAKLVDVFPDGAAYNFSEGICRQRYDPQSNAAEIHLELWPTSIVIRPGHRLRLEVSSSNFPRFDRNPNTGRFIPAETQSQSATQTIHHTSARPSRLILPLIPPP